MILFSVAMITACAPGQSSTSNALNLPPVEVHFGPPPYVYRVGPEISTSATDTGVVRRELGVQGARLGCTAVADVVISPAVQGVQPRSWGFCAYRVNGTSDGA